MVDFQESKTKENLARSFAAECQEGARYQFLATMAMNEDFQYLSYILRTLAKNEMAHAQQFFNKINELGGDDVNNVDIHAGYPFKKGEIAETMLLESKNEKNSGENIYPGFAKIAQDEGYPDVAELFNLIADVELSHQQILEQLAMSYKEKKLYKSASPIAFKCDECGYVANAKQAPKVCPICKLKQGCFRIDISISPYKDLEDKCDCKKTNNCNC